jgi:hypothetical protein
MTDVLIHTHILKKFSRINILYLFNKKLHSIFFTCQILLHFPKNAIYVIILHFSVQIIHLYLNHVL